MKRSGVVNALTLDYRMWKVTADNREKAQTAYNEARSRLTPEEYTRQLGSGEISLPMFDRSFKYRECIANFRAKQGRVSKVERTALEDETDALVERVLANTDVLFVTASNRGAPLLEKSRSFVPTVIFWDEGGQISIPDQDSWFIAEGRTNWQHMKNVRIAALTNAAPTASYPPPTKPRRPRYLEACESFPLQHASSSTGEHVPAILHPGRTYHAAYW